MMSRNPLAPCLVLLALLVGGCSTLPQSGSTGAVDARSGAYGASTAGDASALLDPLGSVAMGQVATLAAGNALGVTRVRVVDEYAAASGRMCRRFTTAEREPRLRLACLERDGHWSLVRGLVAAPQ